MRDQSPPRQAERAEPLAPTLKKQSESETSTSPLESKQHLQAPWKITKSRAPLPRIEVRKQKTQKQMQPQGLATSHPAFQTLQQYAKKGCPAKTGRHWTKEEMQAAIDRGNHISARQPEAVAAYQAEIQEKINKGQA